MTKKDYELIASTIERTVTHNLNLRDNWDEDREQEIQTLAQVVLDLSYTLGVDNPKFDEHKFQIACGFIDN